MHDHLEGDNETLGALLRLYRSQARLTQEQLATLGGLSVRTIRGLESGRISHPRLETVRLLADALGLTYAARCRLEVAAGLPEPLPSPFGSSLPRDIGDFTGREEVAASVATALRDGTGGVPVVAVTGPPGVGKSALAIHVAHRIRAGFPDGQLFVNLRGNTGTPRLDVAGVLGQVLRALGVDSSAVPPDVEERAARLRLRLTDRRVLMVLDDAAAEADVRLLIPGTVGSAVLITSRQPLSGLEGAYPVHLDALPVGRAVELLVRVAGDARVTAEPDMATRIVEACGGLPLAIRIAGARIGRTDHGSLVELAGVLADERTRLDELTAGDLGVRATFALAYRALDEPARQAFRRLGLLDTSEVPGWTIAALLDTGPAAAASTASALIGAGLLDAHGHGHRTRYWMHELLHLFARERAHAEDPPAVTREAVRRALSGWLVVADEADSRLPSDTLGLAGRVPPGWRPDDATLAALAEQPLDWFEQERANLLAAVRQSITAAPGLTAGLVDTMVDFCATRAYPEDWASAVAALGDSAAARGDDRLAAYAARRRAEIALYRGETQPAWRMAQEAIKASTRAGDRAEMAAAELMAGAALRVEGRPAEAHPHLTHAESLFRAIGHRHGIGHIENELGQTVVALGNLDQAKAHFAAAERNTRELGDLRGTARAQLGMASLDIARGDPHAAIVWRTRAHLLLEQTGDKRLALATLALIGVARLETGEPATALSELERVLNGARSLDQLDTEAVARWGIGDAHRLLGNLPAAADEFDRSRQIFARIGMIGWEGRAQHGLGEVAAARGDHDTARSWWTQALGRLESSFPREAATVRERLATIDNR